VTIAFRQRPYEPAPEGFAARFIRDGWRGIERFYGARTDVSTRWVEESGGDRLKELRKRYLRGDLSVLDEVGSTAA